MPLCYAFWTFWTLFKGFVVAPKLNLNNMNGTKSVNFRMN